MVVAPLVFEELGAKENLHLRILTSMLRHHTIMTHPISGYVQNGAILNHGDVIQSLQNLVAQAARVVAGSGVLLSEEPPVTHYNPVGYVLSTAKDKEEETIQRREVAVRARAIRLSEDARRRIKRRSAISPDIEVASEVMR